MSKDMKLIFEGWRSHLLEDIRRNTAGPDVLDRLKRDVAGQTFGDEEIQTSAQPQKAPEKEKIKSLPYADPDQELERLLSSGPKNYEEFEKLLAGVTALEQGRKDGDETIQAVETDQDKKLKALLNDLKPDAPVAKDKSDDGEVTIIEFYNWFLSRQANESLESKIKKALIQHLREGSWGPLAAKSVKKIIEVISGISLRALIGATLGSVASAQNGLETWVNKLLAEMLQLGFSKPTALIWAKILSPIATAIIVQAFAEQFEKGFEPFIQKITDRSQDLVRKTMPPDIMDFFDVPDSILNLMKDDDVVTDFFNDYSEILYKMFKQVKDRIKAAETFTDDYFNMGKTGVTIKQQQEVWNTPIKFRLPSGHDTFAEEALSRIRKSIKSQKLSVTTSDMNSDGTLKTITVESKQRRRIVYRGKK